MAKRVNLGFNTQGVILSVTIILPLKQLKPSLRSTQKYQQVLSSIREVGIIEPLTVFPQNGGTGMYLLVDGHVRLEALKQLGHTSVRCLIATDDEAYTYNKRVNRIATIQEHNMILKAIKSGISEERIAKVLNLDLNSIRQKRDLLEGICREAVELLKNKHMSPHLFGVLKKMKPMRQIEVSELMGAASNFSVPYAKALLAATQLRKSRRGRLLAVQCGRVGGMAEPGVGGPASGATEARIRFVAEGTYQFESSISSAGVLGTPFVFTFADDGYFARVRVSGLFSARARVRDWGCWLWGAYLYRDVRCGRDAGRVD
jgi:prepilin-type processing-associated H-X9-DG protein